MDPEALPAETPEPDVTEYHFVPLTEFRLLAAEVRSQKRANARAFQRMSTDLKEVVDRLDAYNGNISAAKAISEKLTQQRMTQLLNMLEGSAERAAFWGGLQRRWKPLAGALGGLVGFTATVLGLAFYWLHLLPTR